ncbi:hypothetical protein IJO12_09210 [bacterium]|nr:hypothetical protein [bacterium]
MGLKALRLLQQAGKVATGYTGDVVGLGVRKWIKPTSLEELHFAPELLEDTIKISKNSYLSQIKKAITTYAPLDKQKEIIQRFDDFITSQDDLVVIEKLFKGMQKEFNNLPEEKLIARYNKCFKNLKTLRDNNHADYELMVKGGFFDLVEQGKISVYNFRTDFSKSRVSRALLEDLRKVANGEDFITKVDNLSFDEIKNLVKSGEVYSKNGKLYTHNHGLEHEIQLSEDMFLKLFPPVLRHISNQGALGNCWIVGRLDNMMSTQSGTSGIYSLFRQSGDDIFIKFANVDKEILFPKGQILQTSTNKQMTTVPGIAMLEQALAVHMGGRYSSKAVTDITKFAKNPDGLMKMLEAGNVYSGLRRELVGHRDFIDTVSGEYIDNISPVFASNAYRAPNSVGFWEKFCAFWNMPLKKTRQAHKDIISKAIDAEPNPQNLKIGVCFTKNTPKEYSELYNMVPNHQLTLKSVEDDICWVSNPWFNWIEKGVDRTIFMQYLDEAYIPMQW